MSKMVGARCGAPSRMAVERDERDGESGQGVVHFDVPLTFCESHWRPSNSPSPDVAQLKGHEPCSLIVGCCSAYLGCTYHVRSLILCRPSFSVTSAGDMARSKHISISDLLGCSSAHLLADPACSQTPSTDNLSSLYPPRSVLALVSPRPIRSRSPESITKINPCVPV